MSSPTRQTATAIATVWKKGQEDEFGRSVFAAPFTVNVCMDVGIKQKYAAKGIENIPNSVMWMEVLGANNPEKGDHIAKGDFTSFADPANVNSAEVITDVELQDCSLLGEIDDLMIMT